MIDIYVPIGAAFPCVSTYILERLQRLRRRFGTTRRMVVTRAGEVMVREFVRVKVDARSDDGLLIREARRFSLVDVVTGTVYDEDGGRCWSSDQIRLVAEGAQQ